MVSNVELQNKLKILRFEVIYEHQYSLNESNLESLDNLIQL